MVQVWIPPDPPFFESVRYHRTKYHLDSVLDPIDWNLSEGPGSEIVRDEVGQRKDSFEFAELCWFYREECAPEFVRRFLCGFSDKPEVYADFRRTFEFMDHIERHASIDSAEVVRSLFYTILLNAVHAKPQNAFEFLEKRLQSGDTITASALRQYRTRYEARYSATQLYRKLFATYLTPREQRFLLARFWLIRDFRDSGGGLQTEDLDIDGFAKLLFRVVRCRGAHGQELVMFTSKSRIAYPYSDKGKEYFLQTQLTCREWESVVRTILIRYFEAQASGDWLKRPESRYQMQLGAPSSSH